MKHYVDRGLSRLRRWLAPDHVEYQGCTLPAPHLRLCGQVFQDNAYFLKSATNEVDRLTASLGMNENSSILDLGCGFGRLPIGLLKRGVSLHKYIGVDVNPRAIAWCQRHLAHLDNRFRFMHLDIKNDRYNPNGSDLSIQFTLPFPSGSFTIIYLYSVFSHMRQDHIQHYLTEFRRLLAPGGRIFMTMFVAPNVDDMTVNPDNYVMEWQGPLHCVRYNQSFLERMIQEQKFQIDHYDYEQETDRQTGYYLIRNEE